MVNKTLEQAIQEQCLKGLKKSASEIDNLLTENMKQVLFLLDGFEVSATNLKSDTIRLNKEPSTNRMSC